MKKLSLLLLSAFLFTIAAQAQTKWKHDPAHTKIEFIATHMVISEVHGVFEKFGINAETEGDNWEGADINVVVDASSINTGVEKRDKHLQSKDFLYVEEHPKIKFESTSFKKVGDGKYELTGQLTMRGVTKEVTLDVTHTGTIKDPYGKTRAGFKVKGTINRHDYNIKWNQTMESGGAVVGKDIQIIGNIEMIKQ